MVKRISHSHRYIGFYSLPLAELGNRVSPGDHTCLYKLRATCYWGRGALQTLPSGGMHDAELFNSDQDSDKSCCGQGNQEKEHILEVSSCKEPRKLGPPTQHSLIGLAQVLSAVHLCV